jgi:peptide/nickel transport system permease protein
LESASHNLSELGGRGIEVPPNQPRTSHRSRLFRRPITWLLYLAPRIGATLVSVTFVVSLVFLLIHLAPGDPLTYRYQTGFSLTPEIYHQLQQRYGLDKSLFEQYAIYVRDVLRGDLGTSFTFNEPVTHVILGRLPASLILMIPSISIGVVVGTLIGVISARQLNSPTDLVLRAVTLIAYSVPSFWLGVILIQTLSLSVQVFPTGGMYDVELSSGTASYYASIAWHAVLPVIALSSFFVAMFARYSRTSVMEQLTENYVVTARAKGLTEGRVFYGHVLRNALIPVLTMVGVAATYILGGAILIETVFSWPGVGTLTYNAVLSRDYPLVQGIFLLSAVAVIAINLLVDFAYGVVDPRVRA